MVDGLTGEGCIPDPLDVVVQAVGGEAGVTNVDITSLAEIFGVLVNHVAGVVFTRLHHPAHGDGHPGRGQQKGVAGRGRGWLQVQGAGLLRGGADLLLRGQLGPRQLHILASHVSLVPAILRIKLK